MPVVELVLDDVVPAVAAGAGRAGEGEEIGAAGDAGGGAALDRRGADLLIGEEAEELAEAGDLFLIDGVEGFRRDVAAGDAGAAGRDHGIDRRIGDPGLELGDDRRLVVADDLARGELVAVARQHVDQRLAGFVVGLGARVRDRQDRDVDGKERPGFVNSAGHRGRHRFDWRRSAWSRRIIRGIGRPLAGSKRVEIGHRLAEALAIDPVIRQHLLREDARFLRRDALDEEQRVVAVFGMRRAPARGRGRSAVIGRGEEDQVVAGCARRRAAASHIPAPA